MINATEYFAGLFADAFQPVLVYSAEKELCYQNPAAECLLELWANPGAGVFLTPGLLREAEFCMEETRGVSLSEKICDRVLPIMLLPMHWETEKYLVLQVCYQPGRPEQEQLLQVLRNSHSKLTAYMNRIYGVAQSLGVDSPAGNELAQNVRRILRMAKHLYLWLDNEERYCYRMPLNVGGFMAGFVRSVNELYPELNVMAAPCLSELYARAMPEDLELVMSGLLSNARRFGNGDIRFMALKEGDRISIEVWDNGPGVENPNRLFEPGYRTPDQKGAMGLGFSLSMFRELLAMQGAELEYKRINGQTCFRILLQEENAGDFRLAEWDFEDENNLSQLRIELSDI